MLKRITLGYLVFLLVIFAFAEFIANENPIMIYNQEEWHFTLFSGMEKFVEADFRKIITPLPYSSQNQDYSNLNLKPFSSQGRHYLGTDHLGRDLLANLIYGGRTSLLVGLIAITITTLAGVLLGGLAGFLGDNGVKLSVSFSLGMIMVVMPVYYYAVYLRQFAIKESFLTSTSEAAYQITISLLVALVFFVIGYLAHLVLRKVKYLNHKFYFPLDLLVLKLIEIFTSIPGLFLILALVSVFRPSLVLFAFIIAITSWTGLARLIRAEMIKIRGQSFIEAARALGLKPLVIFWRHALPNTFGLIVVYFTFGLSATIVIESTLSFIGAGIPPGVTSWGKLLAGFSFSNWWQTLITAIVVIATILAIHNSGRILESRFNPQSD